MSTDHERLMADWIAGQADPAEQARLNSLLATNPAAKAELAQQTAIDRWLRCDSHAIDIDRIMAAVERAPLPKPPAQRWWRWILPVVLIVFLLISANAWRAPDAAATPAAKQAYIQRVIPCQADAVAAEEHPSAIDGGSQTLRIRSNQPGSARVACIRFDKPEGTFERIELVLHGYSGTGKVAVHEIQDPWEESSLRWYHLPRPGRLLGTLDSDRCILDLPPDTRWPLNLALIGDGPSEIACSARESGTGPELHIRIPLP